MLSSAASRTREVTAFYDRHAREQAGRNRDRNRDRNQSPSLRVREQNNEWKKRLLLGCARHVCKFPFCVDLACGRGGDLPKWQQLQPSALLLTDISDGSLQEASRRLGSFAMASTAPVSVKRADLAVDPIACDDGKAHLVSMQFALHYIVLQGQKALHNFAREVCRVLAPGGIFVATVPREDRMRSFVPDGGFQNSIVEVRFTGDSTYRFSLADAVDAVEEAIVPLLELEAEFSAVGMRRDRDLESRPTYTGHLETDQVLGLYCAVVFRK
jgi:SAM-dependent methyltransferase